MGAWHSSASQEPMKMRQRQAEDTRLAQKTRGWRMGAALSRKKLKGEVYFLDKGLLMGAARNLENHQEPVE